MRTPGAALMRIAPATSSVDGRPTVRIPDTHAYGLVVRAGVAAFVATAGPARPTRPAHPSPGRERLPLAVAGEAA